MKIPNPVKLHKFLIKVQQVNQTWNERIRKGYSNSFLLNNTEADFTESCSVIPIWKSSTGGMNRFEGGLFMTSVKQTLAIRVHPNPSSSSCPWHTTAVILIKPQSLGQLHRSIQLVLFPQHCPSASQLFQSSWEPGVASKFSLPYPAPTCSLH